MTRKARILKRNKKIRDKYDKLRSKKELNVSVYSYKFLIAKLADEYCLSELTIERILNKTI